LPETVAKDSMQFAAFIGKDYGAHYQHLASRKVPLK
jgi:hypothetical protein